MFLNNMWPFDEIWNMVKYAAGKYDEFLLLVLIDFLLNVQ